jgi:predicted TIM-barrel fold metal-dependent hydrolase
MVMSLHGGAVSGRFPGSANRPKAKAATPPVRDQITIASGRAGGMGAQTSLAAYVFSGLFERHPRLKVALIETSAGWYRPFVERLDAAFAAHRHLLPGAEGLRALPSEYLSGVYVNVDRETDAVALRDAIGADKLLFGTDYPHIGSYWPYSRYYLQLFLKDFDERERDDMLWNNGARLYNIEPVGDEGEKAA